MEYSLATLMMNIVNDEKVKDLNEEFARLLSEKKAAGEISIRAIIKNTNWWLLSFFIFRLSRNVSALTK